MGLALISIAPPTQREVEIAWATYRALILAEAEDPGLQSDMAHQDAVATAKQRFERLYSDWTCS
jgi:hypothetical protein